MEESLKIVADLMVIAARTAPKAGGKDFIEIKLLSGKEKDLLGDEMIKYGQGSGKRNFDRDGENVKNSSLVVLIGLKAAESMGLNCGGCGSKGCKDRHPREGNEFVGPQCIYRLLDMGIAIGSAVKIAGLLNVDNRVMYRAGVVARKIGLMDADIVIGIPLSATGKNIYFDRR